MNKIQVSLLLSLLLLTLSAIGQRSSPTAQGPQVVSFESDADLEIVKSDHSEIKRSNKHFKNGNYSLSWQWNSGGRFQIDQPIGYASAEQTGITDRIPVFVVWIYSEKKLPGKKLHFRFHSDDTLNCWFDFGLDFTGWRAGWIAFDRDMQGTPQPGMNRLVVEAPENTHGTLFFDHMILTAYTDSRFPMADDQLPYVNPNAWNHWVILHKNSRNHFDIPVKKSLSAGEKNSIRLIEQRVINEILPARRKTGISTLERIRSQFNQYNIRYRNGSITGTPVWYAYHAQLYGINQGGGLTKLELSGIDLKAYTTLMGLVAAAYAGTEDPPVKDELKGYFIQLTEHLLDQGFQKGSGTGTLSHLGYAIRNLYTSLFLMKEVLTEVGLATESQKAMEWLSGAGDMKQAPKAKGISADAFNTSVTGRLLSILMLPDSPEKATYLKGFSRYINNGLMFADGLEDFLKPDGSVFHHANIYPAYAIGGFDGATQMVYLLSNTDFEIPAEGHQNLKNALLSMRLYCNLKQWPLSLSARHPNGKGELNPNHYAVLALAGSPGKTDTIDTELAKAYLHLSQFDKPTKYTEMFLERGIAPEDPPEGNWSMNYAAMGIHRRDQWQVTARGHSRYLWASEAYIGANYYGRYLTYGHVQILGSGNPVTNAESGFQMEGWDWNRWPGTTTINLPVDQLKAQIIKPGPKSGFEEMLLSDEAFAGAIHLDNRQGAFAMKLHEHDKYHGSHRALKSVFFFDNRIICLGSDIENSVPEYPTETTLFQSVLRTESEPVLLNGEETVTFPLHREVSDPEWKWISDNQNNFYFIHPGNKILLSKQCQESKHQATCEPTSGNFMSAVIEHGNAPENESYEYVILVKSSLEEAGKFSKVLKSEHKPYEVLQKNRNAHIVWDRETNSTAYILFEPNKKIQSEQLMSSTAPCMVMIRENQQQLRLSICDPDLHLYEGPSDDLIIDGKRQERGVYSRDWYYNTAAPSEISITLKGAWDLTKEMQNCSITGREKGNTQLTFRLHHGLPEQVELTKKEK